MKQQYLIKSFNPPTQFTIDQANAIIEEMQAKGYNLTLRQLYYQFVARGLISNTMQSYKRLGKIVSNGRLAGLIDWTAIVDRTRNIKHNSHWTGPGQILMGAAAGYRRDVWQDQPFAIEVWIEKEALIGVIERPCADLDITFFACRGYVSLSELRQAGERAKNRPNPTVIIHLGDHDPSGMDMTRNNQESLTLFAEQMAGVTVSRIALNMDQVDEHNPPPNPAKLSDSRAQDYIARFGNDSWELDALEPELIDQLIRDEVAKYLDQDLMDQAKQRQETERQELYKLADNYQE